MSGEPSSSAPAPDAPEHGDSSSDGALIIAAVGRMEAVIRDERAMLSRLRTSLVEMAQAITRAKAVADSENAAAMLDEFEHRVDAMIEIARGSPAVAQAARMPSTEPAPAADGDIAEQAKAPAAESDEVPTVSAVVQRLGPGDAALEQASTNAPADPATDPGPTVAMLTAMVEALSASIPAAVEPDTAAGETASAANVSDTTSPPSETAPEAASAGEKVTVEPVWQKDAVLHETALLASIEQMGVRPFPPPDEGTAVIFGPKSPPDWQPYGAPEMTLEPPAPSEPIVASQPEQLATTHPHGEPTLTAGALSEPMAELTPFEALLAGAPEPEPAAVAPDAIDQPEVPPSEVVPPAAALDLPTQLAPEAGPPRAAAQSASREPDFDPTDFLFGPQAEPDPAAFLLDPAPTPAAKPVAMPQPEFNTPQDQPTQPEELQQEEPQLANADQPAASPLEAAPHDPLRALNAMSEAERLAIFS